MAQHIGTNPANLPLGWQGPMDIALNIEKAVRTSVDARKQDIFLL